MTTKPVPVANINELRGILLEDIHKLRSGETTAANVNAVVNATGNILQTFKLQMEYAKLTGRTPELSMLEPAQSA